MAEARTAADAGQWAKAAELTRQVAAIWPELPGARDLALTVHQKYPRVVVGVGTLAADVVPNRLDDWATRRTNHFQFRMPGEHALDDQAGQLRLERLRLGDVILDVIGAPADRGRRVVIARAGMDADGEAMPLGGGVDRPVGAFSQGHVAHDQHQDLDKAMIGGATLDLGDGFFDALHGDDDRAAQPGILVEPFLDQPVVQRPAEGVGHVLGKHHLHAVERVADTEGDLEGVERLDLHVPQDLRPACPWPDASPAAPEIGEFGG